MATNEDSIVAETVRVALDGDTNSEALIGYQYLGMRYDSHVLSGTVGMFGRSESQPGLLWAWLWQPISVTEGMGMGKPHNKAWLPGLRYG